MARRLVVGYVRWFERGRLAFEHVLAAFDHNSSVLYLVLAAIRN